MYKYIIGFLISVLLVIPWANTSATQKTSVPVFMAIPSIDQAFALAPRPEDTDPALGVPFQSDVAFWRVNGYAFDISSHCTETPGKYFHGIQVGDILTVDFSDGIQIHYNVYEVLSIFYKNISAPHSSLWVGGDGRQFTAQEFLEYSMLRPENIVLHSSICSQGVSFGQVFIFAQP